MPFSGRNESFLFAQSWPQRRVQRAGLPTPPDEDPPVTDAASLGWARDNGKNSKACSALLGQQLQGVETSDYRRKQGRQQPSDACEYKYTFTDGEEDDGVAAQYLQREQDGLVHRVRELEIENKDYANQRVSLVDSFESERELWKSHCEVLRMENEHLRHIVYMSALNMANTPSLDTSTSDRSETRSLRQQLACMGEQCQILTNEMAKLQEQTAEAYRLLAQERQERLEERNNQLTVVVAKHGLERRMRNREQDLQNEWRRNAELSERCQRLEEDLAKARNESSFGHLHELPLRGKEPNPLREDSPIEDDWSDRPSHVPSQFGYSKLVRWKKRTSEGYDHGVGHGKKQRRTAPQNRALQLAGSESPPQTSDVEQAAPGASAIDHMIAGEFTESETPSRARTPPEL